jgi:hypothetical protein
MLNPCNLLYGITTVSSGVTIDEVYQEIKKTGETMERREDLEPLVDTIEILSNPETMESIKRSESDIEAGRVKEISSFGDLLDGIS